MQSSLEEKLLALYDSVNHEYAERSSSEGVLLISAEHKVPPTGYFKYNRNKGGNQVTKFQTSV